MKVISQKIKDAQSMWPKRVFCDACYAEQCNNFVFRFDY